MEKDKEYYQPPPVQVVPYQLCPKCQGEGTVKIFPDLNLPTTTVSSYGTHQTCDVCNGAKIIPMFVK